MRGGGELILLTLRLRTFKKSGRDRELSVIGDRTPSGVDPTLTK